MDRYKSKGSCYIFLISLLVFLFVLCSIYIYLSVITIEDLLYFSNLVASPIDTQGFFHPILDRIDIPLPSIVYAIEDIKKAPSMTKPLLDGRRFTYCKFDLYNTILIYITLLFLYSFSLLTRVSTKAISVIALHNGSHSPPR